MLWRYGLKPEAPWLAYYSYRWLDVIRDGVQTLSRMKLMG
jgi:hypothetical protein